ncbi:hypothetical protein ACT1U9_08695 [Streptomyces sp. BR1]|uniref:hypothetical protein n=1 Tax=Streptomyces sp. BR1 TaxID=1592323 RepID=UPI00402BF3B9
MRGDETQLNSTGGGDSRERGGPRHAAPRKSLLTKLHMPAGKAMALAAMPTAMFVGMSLTPKLAMADDKTDIPFAPGPCVTRSDQPSASASPSKSPSPSSSKSSTPTPSPSGTADKKPAEPTPTESPSAAKTQSQSRTQPKPATSQAPATDPSSDPTPTKSTNPLDPLGLGDVLGDILGVHPSQSSTPVTPKPSSTPSSTPSTKASTPSTPTKKPTTKSPVTTATDQAAQEIRDAAKEAGQKVEDLAPGAKGLDAKKDTNVPDGAKQPFPCPTADPKALANAKLASDAPLLPDQPWILKTSKLTLSGLNYEGIVEVKTGGGKVKKVLKFTAKSVDIDNLHQLVYGPELNGKPTTAHVKARAGSQSTIRNGTVTMYTEELKGNLFGLIPITFSPQTPPPLNIPYVFFTNATVHQAGQFGGTLTVPGLQNYITDGNPE